MHKLRKSSTELGFTVIEMIVVISIFSILAGAVLFNYKDFNNTTDFSSAAQDIALVVRKAQTESIAGKYPTIGPTQNPVDASWKPSYGVYFENNNKMIYFFDRNNDGKYTSFGEACLDKNTECLEEITLGKNRTFPKLCTYVDTSGAGQDCTLRSVSVVFKRPFPDAVVRHTYDPADINSTPTVPTGPATIVLGDPAVNPGVYSVTVSTLGQISVVRNSSIDIFSH